MSSITSVSISGFEGTIPFPKRRLLRVFSTPGSSIAFSALHFPGEYVFLLATICISITHISLRSTL